MSIASVSGRIKAERQSRLGYVKPIGKPITHAEPRPKPLHVQYREAWRRAGKPIDFPSLADWLASN